MGPSMRIQQFQVSLVDKTRKQLPRGLRKFVARSFFSIVKLSYDNPKLHYEVWVRGQEKLIEVGLHFETCKCQLHPRCRQFLHRLPAL